MNRKVELIGKEFETSKSGKCFVIDYKDSGNVLVMFYEPLYVTKCTYSSLIKGFVENPFFPSVYGRGYIGIGKFSCKDVEVQRIWRNLMSRAYCDEYHKTHHTYRDVEVCKEWLCFQNSLPMSSTFLFIYTLVDPIEIVLEILTSDILPTTDWCVKYHNSFIVFTH